jgi:hypothetical protein
MSDMLEKLLSVEKDATSLTESAVAEANHRKTRARIEGQKEYTRVLAEKAKDNEKRIERERDELSAARVEKNRMFMDELKKRRLTTEELRRAVFRFIQSTRV